MKIREGISKSANSDLKISEYGKDFANPKSDPILFRFNSENFEFITEISKILIIYMCNLLILLL